jgi:DinB superfamily
MLPRIMVGSNAAAELARGLEEANQRALALAQSCSDADWKAVCEGERWPVGVVLDHIADWNEQVDGGIQAYLSGQEVPLTAEMVDAHNAAHATQYAEVSRDEAVKRLQESSSRLVATVRSLSDDDLAITFPLPLAGASMSTTGLIKMVTEHVGLHLASVQRAASH